MKKEKKMCIHVYLKSIYIIVWDYIYFFSGGGYEMNSENTRFIRQMKSNIQGQV